MKYFLLIQALLICFTFQAKGQYDAEYKNKYQGIDTASLNNHLLSLDIVTPGISLESKIQRTKSLYFAATTGFAFVAESNSTSGNSTAYVIVPQLVIEYRKYYNLDKRTRSFKKTAYNSGNYFAFHVAYQGAPVAGKNIDRFETNNGVLIGPLWGIQRNGFLTFGLRLGLGYFTGSSTGVVTPFGDISIGINLSKLAD